MLNNVNNNLIDENAGAPIALSTAAQWTMNYRIANPSRTIAHFFGKNIIEDILSQSGCVGIRMYKAIDTNGDDQIILVGVDDNEDDMESGIVADMSVPCPYSCGNKRVLST